MRFCFLVGSCVLVRVYLARATLFVFSLFVLKLVALPHPVSLSLQALFDVCGKQLSVRVRRMCARRSANRKGHCETSSWLPLRRFRGRVQERNAFSAGTVLLSPTPFWNQCTRACWRGPVQKVLPLTWTSDSVNLPKDVTFRVNWRFVVINLVTPEDATRFEFQQLTFQTSQKDIPIQLRFQRLACIGCTDGPVLVQHELERTNKFINLYDAVAPGLTTGDIFALSIAGFMGKLVQRNTRFHMSARCFLIPKSVVPASLLRQCIQRIEPLSVRTH